LLSHNQFPFEVTITHSVIRLILLQTQAMTIDFLLMSFNSQLVSMLLLITLFSVIIFSWMFLFIISIRSYLQTPLIIRKKHYLTHHHSGHLPFVSVIVPARNEQDNIERCLRSLLAQNYPNFEVIVVNDSSTDNTVEIVRNMKSRETRQREEDRSPHMNRLKIVTVTEKPEKWTGKTWASEQGYSHSIGDILLFTDADTYYMHKDTIYETVSYMLKENLDVLTGVGFIELRDFWSKITMPLWNHFSIVLGANTGAMNNPKSKVAYLVGGFFLIHKKVLEAIGTFRSVKNAIHEDAGLGLLIKNAGYSIKIARIDNGVSALWSRDLQTLWHGIKRTFVPMNKWQIFASLITLFFMALLPFLLLPYNLLLVIDTSSGQLSWISDISKQGPHQQLTLLSFYLNLTSCIIIIISTAVKDIKKYRMTPTYSLLTFLGAGFIIISYIASIISLFTKQSISWRGRTSRVTSNKVNSK
jgi:cellulose synthase/poly-beta-1,6-N-acetylglucosamine synthase-like glycosyltransferase